MSSDPVVRWIGIGSAGLSGKAAACTVEVETAFRFDDADPEEWLVRLVLRRHFRTAPEAQKAAERAVSLAMLDDDRWTPERDLASEVRTLMAEVRRLKAIVGGDDKQGSPEWAANIRATMDVLEDSASAGKQFRDERDEALDALEELLGRRNGKVGPFGPEQREAARLVLVKHGRYPKTDPEAQARLKALGEKAEGEHG